MTKSAAALDASAVARRSLSCIAYDVLFEFARSPKRRRSCRSGSRKRLTVKKIEGANKLMTEEQRQQTPSTTRPNPPSYPPTLPMPPTSARPSSHGCAACAAPAGPAKSSVSIAHTNDCGSGSSGPISIRLSHKSTRHREQLPLVYHLPNSHTISSRAISLRGGSYCETV